MVRSARFVTHCLQTDELSCCFLSGSVVNVDAGEDAPIHLFGINSVRALEKASRMPCRKENYIFLEQSVTVDSKEVDALVTKIGEALQLHNNSAGQTMSCLHGLGSSSSGGGGSSSSSSSSSGGGGHGSRQSTGTAGNPRRGGCCIRLRSRNLRSRASPYNIPGSSDQEWDHFKTWNRGKGLDVTGSEDDPHQLLQELILSGNLIKEAVRRLQYSADSEHDLAKQID
ncbi:GSK-3-binding protein-like [Astyanax mexicanus]|uniref:GSK-3-binding protein-like n=1 Tax=Astyanax mexicanus TaxID=7994 RepID=A0A8T2M592_ASTMX|nr:GSK-3-binding protein-like [Astyanax mexicanus]